MQLGKIYPIKLYNNIYLYILSKVYIRVGSNSNLKFFAFTSFPLSHGNSRKIHNSEREKKKF